MSHQSNNIFAGTQVFAAFGEDLGKALTNHAVRVTGRLGKYAG
jgi:hypothetical protein